MFKIAPPFLLLTLLLSSGFAQAELQLNGLSLHSELNQELFIGAYYTDQLTSDADNQFSNSRKRRLEMRITTRLFSARRAASLWIEGVSINAPQELLSQQAEKVTQFAELINHSLKAGDQLIIDSSGDRVEVKVNDLLLGTIESPELFNMLLSTWIGAVPLSSTFRDELLSKGNIDPTLLRRFENIKPAASRRDIATRWREKQATPQRQPVPPSMNFAAAAIDQPTLNPVAPNIPARPETETNTEQTQNQAPAFNSDSADKTSDEPQRNPETQVAGEPIQGDQEDMEEEELDLSEINVASLVSRKRFHTEIIRNVYRYIRYPNKAVARGHEGTVQVELVIDRQGKVVRATEIEATPHESLNKATMKAIYKAQPYPQPPAEIPGDTLTFRLPISFRIPQ